MKKSNLGRYITLFSKGIVVGFGGIAPGLSGSVLLIIFGLYQKTLEALGSLFVNFKKKINFLLPLVSGMILGVLLFSKLINFLLEQQEMLTRFAFLGLILGTVPMLYKEVKKNGFSKGYYVIMLMAFGIGTWLFTVNAATFPQITSPTLLDSIILGVAVAATAIIPGIDPAVLLSSLGYYELYVQSLATVNLAVLLPMLIGLAAGAICISLGMTYLFKKFYTLVYSIIFGIFLAMIPNMLNESCILRADGKSLLAIIITIIGLCISLYLSNIQKNKESECE
jgi:putative membrane protein